MKLAVFAKLDVYRGAAVAGHGGVEGLHNLRGQCGASDGTDGVAGVVGEVEFVDIGKTAELHHSIIGYEVGGGYGGVVDLGYVEEVVD